MAKYLTNDELLPELKKCRDVFLKAASNLHRGINDPQEIRKIQNQFGNEYGGTFMSNELGRMIYLIVTNIAKKSNWRGYSYVDDMQAEALLLLCRSWWKFDPESSPNPFAYFTTCTERMFITFMQKQKTQAKIKDQIREDNGLLPSHGRQLEHEEMNRKRRLQLEEERSEDPT